MNCMNLGGDGGMDRVGWDDLVEWSGFDRTYEYANGMGWIG